jgi:hypothetical protein
VALHDAMDALNQAMHITPYHPGGMGIKIVINWPAFFKIVDFVLAHNNS